MENTFGKTEMATEMTPEELQAAQDAFLEELTEKLAMEALASNPEISEKELEKSVFKSLLSLANTAYAEDN